MEQTKNQIIGDRYYKAITEFPRGWWNDKTLLNKFLMGSKIQDMYEDWDIHGEHKYLLGDVEPFYKYALYRAEDN